MKQKQFILIVMTLCIALSCKDDVLPKPKGYLRLEYPNAIYEKTDTPLPFSFEKNKAAQPLTTIKTTSKVYGIDVKYPALKGTIYLTYKKIENNNLDSLLRDAQNLTQKHTIKADEIIQNEYLNKAENVYGMIYEIGGDAASQSQFYVTDSINHFLSGSLYFYAKPNYDSIYPAAEYLKKDIKRIMETIHWK